MQLFLMQHSTMKLFCVVLLTLIFSGKICFSAESKENNISSILHETANIGETSTFQPTYTMQDSVIIKLAENRLVIENLPKEDILEIYNIMGVKVYNRRVNAGTNEYILSLPKGYYILKIGKLTKKIAIR